MNTLTWFISPSSTPTPIFIGSCMESYAWVCFCYEGKIMKDEPASVLIVYGSYKSLQGENA